MMMDEYTTQIKEWKIWMEIIGHNMIAMNDDVSTRMIRDKVNDKNRPYTGETQSKAEYALTLLEGLWLDYSLLREVIDNAESIASKNSIFRNTDEKVKSLLEGRSVVRKIDHIPTTERGLLEEANQETRMTLMEMLTDMQQRFDTARSIISGITGVTESISSRLASIKQKVTLLENRANALGVHSEMFSMVFSIEDNPLGCWKEVELLEARLIDYNNKLQKIEMERKEVDHLRICIKELLFQLQEVAHKSKDVQEEVLKKILNPDNLVEPINEQTLNSLKDWLITLEKNILSGHIDASKVGLSKLKQECILRLETEQNNYQLNRAALNECEDLRGRYSALCAKADALTKKGLFTANSDFEEVKKSLQRAMDTCPFNLNESRKSMQRFEKMVLYPN